MRRKRIDLLRGLDTLFYVNIWTEGNLYTFVTTVSEYVCNVIATLNDIFRKEDLKVYAATLQKKSMEEKPKDRRDVSLTSEGPTIIIYISPQRYK